MAFDMEFCVPNIPIIFWQVIFDNYTSLSVLYILLPVGV